MSTKFYKWNLVNASKRHNIFYKGIENASIPIKDLKERKRDRQHLTARQGEFTKEEKVFCLVIKMN